MIQIPKTMRAVVIEEQGANPVCKEIPIPQPSDGQVLIKVDSSPINPSDTSFLKGVYSSNKPYPCVPGFEGSGTVILSGGGLMAWSLQGKRVAFTASQSSQFGCWAEYCVTDALYTFEIDADLSFQQAASNTVNPLTVIGMLETVKEAKCQAVVHTAAASQLGRMMVRYFHANGVRVINVVRRNEQIDILRKEGADLVLNQTDPEFLQKLKSMCSTLNATILFDAIGGDIVGQILDVMPHGSTAYVYGGLSGQPVGQISITNLIFQGKTVTGWWLSQWIKEKNVVSKALFMRKLKSLLKTQLKTEIAKEVSLEEFKEGIQYYVKNMSAGKVLIRPSLQPTDKQTEKEKVQELGQQNEEKKSEQNNIEEDRKQENQ